MFFVVQLEFDAEILFTFSNFLRKNDYFFSLFLHQQMLKKSKQIFP